MLSALSGTGKRFHWEMFGVNPERGRWAKQAETRGACLLRGGQKSMGDETLGRGAWGGDLPEAPKSVNCLWWKAWCVVMLMLLDFPWQAMEPPKPLVREVPEEIWNVSVIWGNGNGRQSEKMRGRQVHSEAIPAKEERSNEWEHWSRWFSDCVCECSCVYLCVHVRIQDVSSWLLPCLKQGLLLFTVVYAKVTSQQASEDSPSYLVVGELALQTCHGLWMEVRGQLAEVVFFLPMCILETRLRTDFVASTFARLSISASPVSGFMWVLGIQAQVFLLVLW